MLRLASSSLLPLLAVIPLIATAAPGRTEGPAVQVKLVHGGAARGAGGAAWAPATVAAIERATLSTRVAATVKAVLVREGERVKRGQLVVSLADADLRGAVGAAETALAAAAAQEKRVRSLLAEGAAAQADLDMASARRAEAEAAVAAARSSLEYAQLRAPFAGTIQARRVEPGDLVGPGQPLLVLEGDALELVASLSDRESAGLALAATVRFDAGDAAGTAQVTALTPGGDPLSHRRGLRARVVQSGSGLRSGAFARIELPAGGEAVARAWVPRSAVVERGDLTGVFVAAAGRAELRWIAPGEPAGDGILVRAGLRPDEAVVDAPGSLRDGQPVEVVP